jgi:hypothetical protein
MGDVERRSPRSSLAASIFEPTMLTHVTIDMEEVDLGRVVSLCRFKAHAEAIRTDVPRISATPAGTGLRPGTPVSAGRRTI